MNGRKQKSNSEKRKHPISCRLTDQELSQVDSQRGGMTRGEFLRRAAMDAELPPLVPEINKDAWHELSKLNGNFNQLCKQLNTFGALNNPDEMSEIIQSLRLALLGVKESVDPKKHKETAKLTTIQDRHYELRRDGCTPNQISKLMLSELHQILQQIGFSESNFYGWDEVVFNEFGGWCEWAFEAVCEVERDTIVSRQIDDDYGISIEPKDYFGCDE